MQYQAMNISRWSFFFVIAIGLGYPAVFRYSPPTIGGLSDTANYFESVEKGVGAGEVDHWKYRILIPALARPLRSMLFNATGRPESTAAAILLVNAAFVATMALVTYTLAIAVAATPASALVASFIWLCSFPVSNYHLAGMVDSVEALAVGLTMLAGVTGRWSIVMLVPLLALGKETSVPLAVSAAAGFSAYRCVRHEPCLSAIAWTVTLAALGVGGVATAYWLVDGAWTGLMALIEEEHSPGDFFSTVWQTLINEGNLYVFVALLPAGLAGRKAIPASLWVAACFASLGAIALAIWNAASANVARPVFSAIGPVLAIGAAAWLSKRSVAPISR